MDQEAVINDLRKENERLKQEISRLKVEIAFFTFEKLFRGSFPSASVAIATLPVLRNLIDTCSSLKLKGALNLIMAQLYPNLAATVEVNVRKRLILDVMETMTSGAIKIQQLLIGVLLYSCSCPRVIWRLLSKLRIAPTEKSVKKWLTFKLIEDATEQYLTVYGIDTTYMASYHSITAARIHPVTICVATVTDLKWHLSQPIFKTFRNNELNTFVLQTFKEQLEYQSWYLLLDQRNRNNQKLSFPLTSSTGNKNYRYPFIKSFKYGVDSKKVTPHGFVDDIILSMVKNHCNGDNCLPFFLYGDYEYYSKIVRLSLKEERLIPVLAVWHYSWHFLKAIFVLHGDWLLMPIAEKLKFRKIKEDANDFHSCSGFVLTVTKAALTLISKVNSKSDVIKHFQECKSSAVMYAQLVHFVYTTGVPFCILLMSIRSADFVTFRKCVISSLRLFLATKKSHYSFLTVHFIWMTAKLQPMALEAYISNLWFPLTKNSAFFSGNDVIIENVI